jgi:hypothetical protein
VPLSGAAFQKRVACVPGAIELLEIAGFKVWCLRGGCLLRWL